MLNREGNNSNTIWGVINGNTGEEREDGPEWFVSSKEEWAAFSDKFNISDSSSSNTYYGNFGLSEDYWSSSQRNTEFAYDASFKDSSLGSDNVYILNYVRLVTTF